MMESTSLARYKHCVGVGPDHNLNVTLCNTALMVISLMDLWRSKYLAKHCSNIYMEWKPLLSCQIFHWYKQIFCPFLGIVFHDKSFHSPHFMILGIVKSESTMNYIELCQVVHVLHDIYSAWGDNNIPCLISGAGSKSCKMWCHIKFNVTKAHYQHYKPVIVTLINISVLTFLITKRWIVLMPPII